MKLHLIFIVAFLGVASADTPLRSLYQDRSKHIDPRRAMIVFKNGENEKSVAKRDTLLRSLETAPNKHIDQKMIILELKNGKTAKKVSKRDTLLRSLHQDPSKHIEPRRSVGIILKNGENKKSASVKHIDQRRKMTILFKNGENEKSVVKRDTLLKKSLETAPTKHIDQRRIILELKNLKTDAEKTSFLKALQSKKRTILQKDTLPKSRPVNGMTAAGPANIDSAHPKVKRDTLLRSLRNRFHKNRIAKRDTLLRSLHSINQKDISDGSKEHPHLFRNIRHFPHGKKHAKYAGEKASVKAARQDRHYRFGDWPEFPRKKRDIAATVVGAAVSSVVSNLMKNVEESVERANEAAASNIKKDVPQGSIIGFGEIAPVSNDVVAAKGSPVANEAVPLPFAPIKADVISEIKQFAPVHADVGVIIGNSTSTTSTSAPVSGDKKGFFATLFGSFKQFFGTVTNSIGGFFIDMGSRITNFVEKRIKV